MDNKQKVVSNLIWRFMERFGSQLVSFVVQIVLARMLAPSVFGTVAKVTIITSILLVFVDSGMANSLIQKKDPDDLDFSSVFFFNLAFCLVLYAGLFAAAPAIARFYKDAQLTAIIRVLGLTVVVAGVKNVQQAYVSKTLQFKRFFFATLGGTLLSAVVGIAMVYAGFGVWAIVAQQLTNVTVNTGILWLTVGWKPKLMFSFARLKGLLSYGWKLLVSGLLDTVYNKLREILIAVFYTDADLAFYNRGMTYPNLLVENINASIDSVLLPVLSAEQEHKEQVRNMTRRAIRISTYVMMPLMMGLAVCAEPLIRLLLTEKWLPCVPYLRIFCFSYAFYPLHTANLNAIKAMGRSDLFLKLEIIKKVIGVAVLAVTLPYGVYAMALSLLFTSVLSQLINSWPNAKLLGYSYAKQLKDMLPAILLSIVMGLVVYPITFFGWSDWLTLPVQVIVGAAVYIAGSVVFKLDSFNYLLSILKKFVRRGEANAQ
ncbi:MAG: lipopolysaccharide biosynthesis protein [Oscillospiraceae bacterium]|nr:lipopolysaccharide biosynthesis protein [Oscillospiraceae bacterium]